MFAIYVTALILGVYVVPGLALVPRAALDSRLAYAIPILSVLVITLLGRGLKVFGVFSEPIVLLATVAFAATAAYRLNRIRSEAEAHWPPAHRLIYLFSACAGAFVAVRLGISSFETDDEIYSWNMWAIQHALGEPHDLFYTRAPYPQTFPYLIAWSYQLLQSIDLQSAVKCSFAVLCASMMAAIGAAATRADSKSVLWFIGLTILALGTTGLYQSVTRGLAETLMIPALTVSVALYLLSHRNPEHTLPLWLASASAIVAGLSKQPGLLWLMAMFPILAAVDVVRRRRTLLTLLPVAIAVLAGVLWVVTEGAGFLDNQGVIRHSQQGRDWLEQLLFATSKHMGGRPGFVVLLLLCTYVVLRGRTGRTIFFGLVLPWLGLWFFFGAYNTRLGGHVFAVSALLIAANEYWPSTARDLAEAGTRVSTRVRRLAYAAMGTAVLAAGIGAWERLEKRGPEFSLYDGGKNTIYKYFGDDAAFVHREIYRSPNVLWIPSNYIYGVFYGHNPIIRPDHRAVKLDVERIRADIVRDRPDYLFDAGDYVDYGPGSALLRKLVAQCEDWFETVATPPNRYGYTVYRLDNDAVDRNERCNR